MSGTSVGGHKAKKANMARYGKDFYARIGALGGMAPTKEKGSHGQNLKGFARYPELASEAGKIGGQVSRRGKSRKKHIGKWHNG